MLLAEWKDNVQPPAGSTPAPRLQEVIWVVQIDMPMPEKCSDCIFCDDYCSCIASDYDGLGINVGCAYRTDRRDIRCPLKEVKQ